MALSIRNSGVLRQLAMQLKEAPRRIQKQAAEEIRTGIASTIDREFESKTGPSGEKWRPPRDGGETMVRTGKLRGGFTVEVVQSGTGLSLRISNSREYAKWLQQGTAKMDARPMVPGAVLPESWRRIFVDAYDRAIADWWSSTRR